MQVPFLQAFVRKVFIDYLRLLINSRDEIALARVINVPERHLPHKAFTELKRLARKRGLPMYQVSNVGF